MELPTEVKHGTRGVESSDVLGTGGAAAQPRRVRVDLGEQLRRLETVNKSLLTNLPKAHVDQDDEKDARKEKETVTKKTCRTANHSILSKHYMVSENMERPNEEKNGGVDPPIGLATARVCYCRGNPHYAARTELVEQSKAK